MSTMYPDPLFMSNTYLVDHFEDARKGTTLMISCPDDLICFHGLKAKGIRIAFEVIKTTSPDPWAALEMGERLCQELIRQHADEEEG